MLEGGSGAGLFSHFLVIFFSHLSGVVGWREGAG